MQHSKVTIALIAGIGALIGLCASAIAADTSSSKDVHSAELCNYCQDYTDPAMTAEPIKTAYRVGIGYPDRNAKQGETRKEPSLIRASGRPASPIRLDHRVNPEGGR